jgi:hypothetical protein
MAESESLETPEVAPAPKEKPKPKAKPEKKAKIALKGFEYNQYTLDLDEDELRELLHIALRVYELRSNDSPLPMNTLRRRVKSAAHGGPRGIKGISSLRAQIP